ncbi:hypothetical protein [Oryza sativa Japonica Group]|uniref:Uncharacterized protein n=1 Tax=Oryza sativa subsp. japonica TaxID=39947 RepID=Q5ZB28_ORYSJ|nr:hypothetical protein [Oryza sativa Japonica Group]
MASAQPPDAGGEVAAGSDQQRRRGDDVGDGGRVPPAAAEGERRGRLAACQAVTKAGRRGRALVVALITDQPSFMVASRGSSAEGSRSQTNNRWIRELHVVLWDACDPAVYVDLADGSGHYTVRRLA